METVGLKAAHKDKGTGLYRMVWDCGSVHQHLELGSPSVGVSLSLLILPRVTRDFSPAGSPLAGKSQMTSLISLLVGTACDSQHDLDLTPSRTLAWAPLHGSNRVSKSFIHILNDTPEVAW